MPYPFFGARKAGPAPSGDHERPRWPRRTSLLLGALAVGLISISVSGQPVPLINTVAGSGRVLRGLGGPAVDVALAAPFYLASDTKGDLYFTDKKYNVAAKIDPAGKLWWVAGSGIFGMSPDVGPADQANFRYAEGIALDALGNVYVADTENSRVRKITPDGTATTIAGCDCVTWGEGGPATQAWVTFPTGLTFSATGELYIVDNAHSVVRKIDAQGNIHTVVGFVEDPPQSNPGFGGDGGPANKALLNSPTKVAFDSSGIMYIADSGNSRIRKVALDGTISTVVGGGTALPSDGLAATAIQMAMPSDVVTDSQNNLIITDTWHNIVLKVTTTGTVKVIAGSLIGSGFSGDGGRAVNAQLAQPAGVALDAAGNLYIADNGNGRIRKVDGSGVITTVAGNGETNFAGDGGPAILALLDGPMGNAVDSQGNLFIADTGNNRVRKVDVGGTITTVAGTGQPGYSGDGGNALIANLNAPAGVAVDNKGNVFIADTKNGRIRKVDSSGVITSVAGSSTGAWYCGDGIPATTACLGAPQGVAIDASDNLWIADSGNNRIRRVGSDGIIQTVAGDGNSGFTGDGVLATTTGLWSPYVVLPDTKGGFYIADTLNMRVRYVNASGVIDTVAGNGEGGDSPGTLATEARVEFPSAIAVGRDGSLYIGGGGSDVLRVTPDGHIGRIAGDENPYSALSGFTGDGGPALGALLNLPSGLAMDAAGDLYVSDMRNDRVRKITMNAYLVRRHRAVHH